MLSILELPTVRRQVSRVSVGLYHQMAEYNENGRRTELVRGVIIEKMPKSPLHSFLVVLFGRLIQAVIGSDMHVRLEQPLTLADSEPEPDVAVVTGAAEGYRLTHPFTAVLAIEIAVTSEELDREKAVIYAEAGVPEYWIVLAERGQIEVCTLPREGFYTQRRLYARGETLVSVALPALQVELAELFRG